jgi:hypothetical protein
MSTSTQQQSEINTCVFNREDFLSESQFPTGVSYADGQGVVGIDRQVLIRYLKASDGSLAEEAHKYRSVVVNQTSQKVVSFSLPKAIGNAAFVVKNPSIIADNIVLSEIIEGTMINMFFDVDTQMWEIATKSNIGGNTVYNRTDFYGTHEFSSFRTMFCEALGTTTDAFPTDPVFNDFIANWSYSFVLQHPKNHIVHDNREPRLYLVAVYQMNEDGNIQYVPQSVFQNAIVHEKIWFPRVYTESELTGRFEVNMRMCIMPLTFGGDKVVKTVTTDTVCEYFTHCVDANMTVGCMAINVETGDRTKFIRSEYLYMKSVRGNHPNIKYAYHEMVRENKVHIFLHVFPQYTALFNQFYQELIGYVDSMFYYYCALFVNKQKIVPKTKMAILHRIHQEVYVRFLQPIHFRMTPKAIYDFITQLDAGEIFALLKVHAEESAAI